MEKIHNANDLLKIVNTLMSLRNADNRSETDCVILNKQHSQVFYDSLFFADKYSIELEQTDGLSEYTVFCFHPTYVVDVCSFDIFSHTYSNEIVNCFIDNSIETDVANGISASNPMRFIFDVDGGEVNG